MRKQKRLGVTRRSRFASGRSRAYIRTVNRFREIPIMAAVRDNKSQHRFELDAEGQLAFANYRVTPQAVIITHTETPRALRGRGIASELVKGALEAIRADGHKVIAGCGFVVDYLNKHPEYRDLVA
jgi:predicted GNAT family acetyltransferase